MDCRRRAEPGGSWIASGEAATTAAIARAGSSMPHKKVDSLKNPWSIATSKHLPSGAKRRFKRYDKLTARFYLLPRISN
jgi:hypothetical protein